MTMLDPMPEQVGLPIVSCASASPPIGEVRTFSDPLDYGISVVATLFDASSYRWNVAADTFVVEDDFSAVLRGFYSSMAPRRAPTSLLVKMRHATLIGGVLYVEGDSGLATVYETVRPGDKDVIWMAPLDVVVAPDRSRFGAPNSRHFFLGSAGSFNYGHWLVDDLPRLKGIVQLMAASPGPICVVIESFGTEIDRVRIESIKALLDRSVRVEIIARHEAYFFETLFYPTPVSDHPVLKSPIALDYMSRRALEKISIPLAREGRADRLFVERAAAHGRSLLNSPEVRALVEHHGFTVVDPGRMSFADQVRLFAAADIVIGQMGAAMTNTLFCRPATTLLFLAPSGWIEPFYFDLAMARGHDYRVLFGPPAAPDVPPHQSNFEIPIDALEGWLETL